MNTSKSLIIQVTVDGTLSKAWRCALRIERLWIVAHRKYFFSAVGWEEITLLKVLIHTQAARQKVLKRITHKVMLSIREVLCTVECLILEVHILPALTYSRVGVVILNKACKTLVVGLSELIRDRFIRL
jgi:hypothetical protein